MIGRGQQLDYSDLRNGLVPLPLGPSGNASDLRLAGSARGNVSLQRVTDSRGDWARGNVSLQRVADSRGEWTLWVFFPGTRQLRNQKGGYKLQPGLGEPMCLSLCKPFA